MENLKQILIDHANRYSLMEPTDAVKLIYQNEFGGGHMIRNEASCIAYLRKEYESVPQSADAALAEDIGNGLVRVHLNALDAFKYTPDSLASAFIRSAAIHIGSKDSFLAKLDLLRQATEEGYFSFQATELEEYLERYALAGYPMVSHSDTYRKAYSPAYRIILRDLINDL